MAEQSVNWKVTDCAIERVPAESPPLDRGFPARDSRLDRTNVQVGYAAIMTAIKHRSLLAAVAPDDHLDAVTVALARRMAGNRGDG
jgi:hypothetical protein